MHRLLLLAAIWLATVNAAWAQATQAQRDAIRAACRSDFIANCSGVTPGGTEAFKCLEHNSGKLSPPCKSAVEAVAAKPAAPVEAAPPASPLPAPAAAEAPAASSEGAAASQSQPDHIAAVRKACTLDDFMAHCSWIQPSSPEVLLCLKANASDLSPGCKAAVADLPVAATPAAAEALPRAPQPSPRPAEPQHASAPVPAPPAPTAAAPQKPSQQQVSAIRSACRSDFMAHCSSVQPGGAAALQCLQRNAASLSGPCKTAVAAAGGAPSTAAATPAGEAPAAAPSAPALGAMPSMRPREALQILRVCAGDQQAFCAGLPIGGGRVVSCLAENAQKLSPGCYAALREAAGR